MAMSLVQKSLNCSLLRKSKFGIILMPFITNDLLKLFTPTVLQVEGKNTVYLRNGSLGRDEHITYISCHSTS